MSLRELLRSPVARVGYRASAHNHRATSLPRVPRLADAVPSAQFVAPLRPENGDAPGAVAFVFQGGGSLAAAQVGMLRALFEAGIQPDLLGGSSAGALNAVAFASDPTVAGLDRLQGLWLGTRRRDVAPVSFLTLGAALVGRRDGLFSDQATRTFLGKAFTASALSSTLIPVYVVATDMSSGQPVVISDGDTVTALLASSAFPGLYPPVKIGTQQLVDGGVSADIPILQGEALGAKTTYVLPAASTDDGGWQPHGPLPMAYRALGQILDAASHRDTIAARGTVHLLPAPTSRASNPLDFRYTGRLIHDGYRLTSRWLADQPVHSAITAFQ